MLGPVKTRQETSFHPLWESMVSIPGRWIFPTGGPPVGLWAPRTGSLCMEADQYLQFGRTAPHGAPASSRHDLRTPTTSMSSAS